MGEEEFIEMILKIKKENIEEYEKLVNLLKEIASTK